MVQRWKLHTGEDALGALEQLVPAGVIPTIWGLDDLQGSGTPEEVIPRVAGIIGEDTGPEISLIQAAPLNDAVHILNKAYELMGRPRQHHGALLQTAADVLSDHKYARMELKLLDGYLDFTEARDWSAAAAAEMAAVWFEKDHDRKTAEMIIQLELKRYARSNRELNGYIGKIGFVCVALVARK